MREKPKVGDVLFFLPQDRNGRPANCGRSRIVRKVGRKWAETSGPDGGLYNDAGKMNLETWHEAYYPGGFYYRSQAEWRLYLDRKAALTKLGNMLGFPLYREGILPLHLTLEQIETMIAMVKGDQ